MDRIRSPGGHSRASSSYDDEKDSSGRSSTGNSIEEAAGHTIVTLSPRLDDVQKVPSPRVYTVNRAREMADDRLKRIIENANRKKADNAANNNLPSQSLDSLKAYIDIQREIRMAIDGIPTQLDAHRDELNAVRAANSALEKAINDDIAHYRTGPSKQLLNAASGVISNLLTFCAGTLLANALDKPVASLLLIPVCWALCERFPPMVRATSWGNKHADVTYLEIMRLTERTVRDWVRQLCGLNPKLFGRNGQKLTASQASATYSLFNAWRGKVLSDDVVSYSYSACYIARNIPLRLFASKSFLATASGMALSTGSLALAGLSAGAMTALAFQELRRQKYLAENPDSGERGETLVKSRKIWKAEATLEEAKIRLVKLRENTTRLAEESDITGASRLMEADRNKASKKSGLLGSLQYEFSCLFQKKSHLGDEENGEVAGRRIQTLSGFFAKILCLVANFLFVTYVLKAFAEPNFSVEQQLGLLTLAPIVLIAGFMFRKELELVARAANGIPMGLADAVRHYSGHHDKYHSPVTPATPATPSPGRAGSDNEPACPQTRIQVFQDVARQLDFRTPAQQQACAIDGDSDERSSNHESSGMTSPRIGRNNSDHGMSSPYRGSAAGNKRQASKQQSSSSVSSSEETV